MSLYQFSKTAWEEESTLLDRVTFSHAFRWAEAAVHATTHGPADDANGSLW